jgi:hypothetical protein
MSSSRTLAKFQEFNENPSVCSAWLKDKDRCCKRKIAAKDQERKNSLFRSISGNQIYGGDEARELAGLHFCNGLESTSCCLSSIAQPKLEYSPTPPVLCILLPFYPTSFAFSEVLA